MKEYAVLALLAIAVALLVTYGCIAARPPANWTNLPPVITNATPTGPNASNTSSNTSNPATNPPSNASNASNQTGPVPPANETPALTRETCEQAHGHWNECGSACRGAPPGTTCITMCVQYCECGGIAGFGCPDGYECTDYLPKDKDGNPVPDAMGICKIKTSR